MAWLDDAWGELAFDALVETLKVDSRLKREMIQFLFDEGFWDQETLTWDAATARFNSCLNRNKEAFFKLGEVWALMKRFGRHQLFHAMAQDLGYYPPQPMPTEERRQALMERMATVMEHAEHTFNATRAELARIDAAPVHVEHSMQRARPRFSKGPGDTAP